MNLGIKKLTLLSCTLRNVAVIGFSAVALSTLAISAKADLVTNGSFETNGGTGQINFNTSATGWTVPGDSGSSYVFLYAPGTADTTGAAGVYGNLALWGPNNGSANGLPASSPDGGYFLGSDGNFPGHDAPIQQTINGLTVGDTYAVSFYWAAAQQAGFNGDTQQSWAVSFGGQTLNTPTFDLPSHGFSGWMSQTFDFTADNTSDVLSFLAVGNLPVPPFALLDGVSVNAAVPEPGSVTLLLGMLGLMVGVVAFRSQKRSQG